MNGRGEGRRGEDIEGRPMRGLIIAQASLQNFPDSSELLKPTLITSHSSAWEAFLTATVSLPAQDSRRSVLFGQWGKKMS